MTETGHNPLILGGEHLTEEDVSHWTEAGVVGGEEKQQTGKNVEFVPDDFYQCRVLKY